MNSQVSLNQRTQRRGLEWLLCGNYDMATNVVSKLSTVMFHRLKLVSKRFNDRMSDRAFARLQNVRTETVCGLFFQERLLDNDDYVSGVIYLPVGKDDNKVYDTVLEFLPHKVTIQAACNGLICCCNSFFTLEPVVYICNPLRKECNMIQLSSPNNVCSLALAFDPFKNPVHVSTHFKVVAARKVGVDRYLFDIYSSETRSWKKSEDICSCNHDLVKNKGIFAGGNLFWSTNGDEILMLNLENELTFLVKEPLPATEFTMRRRSCIGESEGILHYVMLSEYGLQLWMLEDWFSSKWVLTCSISLKCLKLYNQRIFFSLSDALKIHTWLDLLAFKDGILFIRASASIYSFDLKTRKVAMLSDLSTIGVSIFFPPIVIPYSLSLVPLDEN